MMLTAERLREVLHYDPQTGVFTWLVSRRNNSVRKGSKAGYLHIHQGRIIIKIDGEKYAASRLAYLYMTGSRPPNEIDHKDRDPSNDRWTNLRPATHSQQQGNKRLPRNNTSGYRGVVWLRKKWIARNSGIGLGRFTSKEEAARAYDRHAIEHYGEFATLNFPQRRAAQ
jgi:hypothetical protein